MNQMEGLLFGVFLTISLTGIGQTYFPFPDDSAKWCITYEEGSEDYYNEQYGLVYSVENDTIINDLLYKNIGLTQIWKLWSNYYGYLGGDDSDFYLGKVGCFREEDKKIFFYKFLDVDNVGLWDFGNLYIEDTVEVILYDFGMDIGDQIIQHVWWTSDSIRTVVDTSSILLQDGFYHKQLQTQLDGTTQFWIEGIGSDGGLFDPYFLEFEWYSFDFNCFWSNNNYIYGNDSCDFIEIEVGIESDSGLFNIKISPNPFTDYISVSNLPAGLNARVEIYDIVGQEVLNSELINYDVNTSSLQSGLFYLIIISDDAIIYSQKIIKI